LQASSETEGRGLGKSGILVLDKPEGMTSAQVVGRVKKLLRARKAGHAGTLDPFATGVLVCMLNQATRLGRFLLAGDKSYTAVLHLGIETDTQDSTGAVIAQHAVQRDVEDRLVDAFHLFEGEIEQRPPVFSALKHKGVPLYKLARQGLPVQKPARRVTIKGLQVTAVELPEVHFQVTCSAGTYIRSLCADVGRVLGCGGHLSRLRRTASSGFRIADAISLSALETRVGENNKQVPLVSPAAALTGMPKMIADETAAFKINNGVRLTANDLQRPDPQSGFVRAQGEAPYCKVVDRHERLLAVVRFQTTRQQFDYCCVFPNPPK
jgi:tRNA pseudouridine55 synthase